MLVGVAGALTLSACHLVNGSSPTTATTSVRAPVYTPAPSTTSTAPTRCQQGAVSERVDFGSFPPAICLNVGATLTVLTGHGWSAVTTTDPAVLGPISAGTFKAATSGTASLQSGWNPPVGSEVTSESWSQTVTVR